MHVCTCTHTITEKEHTDLAPYGVTSHIHKITHIQTSLAVTKTDVCILLGLSYSLLMDHEVFWGFLKNCFILEEVWKWHPQGNI